MAAAEEHARNTGASKIVLETASDNYAAQLLYESLGYRRTAEGEACHYCFDIE
jgi:ribosomal protein S18 acetylase RimI-like enzyme